MRKIVNGGVKRDCMNLIVMNESAMTTSVMVSLEDVDVPVKVFRRMELVPDYDVISHYQKSRYLLQHIRDTKQKIKLVSGDAEAVKLSLWGDVFQQ